MPNPIIPEEIVIHLGSPDTDAMNVTETFADYIKNVASSEIYPTWPEEALKANIMAQISVALNRVYTEFYRANGYNFDITNSPAYDQTYVYGRDIFENISVLVDELFDSYIRREGNIEPLFAEFCDGVEVQCNGLEQWGSVNLAEGGLDYFSILQRYYGNDIEIVRDVPVENTVGSAPPVPLREGDTGRDVELIQRKLNRISVNYPGIPRITPADGFFGTNTTESVRKFQEVFGLTPDGIVGRATWNEIQFIYNAVKKLYSVSSEGLKLSEVTTRYPGSLSEGDSGEGVSTIQYYLSYISLFVPSVLSAGYDGSFGPTTANSVRSFQRTYGLPETGVVDRQTFDNMENVYYGIVSEIDYEFRVGRILPFPGRVLRVGIEGNDVRVLQEYLNYIAETYPEIPKVEADGIFGDATARQVAAFKELFGIPGTADRVNAVAWNAISSVYDDLFDGGSTAAAFLETDHNLPAALPYRFGECSEEITGLNRIIFILSDKYRLASHPKIGPYYGYKTAKAVSELRKIYALRESDVVDAELYKRMTEDIYSLKKE